MEKVWDTLVLQRKGFHPTGITAANGKKDVYFSGVCKLLLDNTPRPRYCYRTTIIELLFGCFRAEDIDHWGFKPVIPTRYTSYFTTHFSDAQILALVLKASHHYPMSLYCDLRFQFQYWEITENYSLLAAYLKGVCNLHLSYDKSYYSIDAHALCCLKFIAHILSKRLLSSLVLKMSYELLLNNTLLALRPLLIGDKGSHSQLKTFAITFAITLHNSCNNVSDVTVSEISRVLVANQTSLHTIELTSGSIPHHVYNRLSSFFKYPHLRSIRLSATHQLGTLQEILYAFLTAPRSSSSENVCLHIDNSDALKSTPQDMSGFTPDLSCLILPEENRHKSLVLSLIRLQLPHPLIMWLQECVVLRLKKLELSLEIAHCFLNHQRMEVEEFSLVRNNLYQTSLKALGQLKKPGCFDNVLRNECLKRFRFSVMFAQKQHLVLSGILLNIVHGLHKQAEVGNLEELYLLYHPKDGSTLEIFEAIFSLPQMEKLTLALWISRFCGERYLEMLERSWREKAGGKQLKKLIILCTGVGVNEPSCIKTVQMLHVIKIITRELVSAI